MTMLAGSSHLTDSTVMATGGREPASAPTPSAATTTDFRPWPVEREELTIQVSVATRRLPWFGGWWKEATELFGLPPNWNGYGERRVHGAAIKRAAIVIDSLQISGPPPHMSPTSDGSVQLEWHAGDSSIEVLIAQQGVPEAVVFNGDDEVAWHVRTTGDASRLADAITALFAATVGSQDLA